MHAQKNKLYNRSFIIERHAAGREIRSAEGVGQLREGAGDQAAPKMSLHAGTGTARRRSQELQRLRLSMQVQTAEDWHDGAVSSTARVGDDATRRNMHKLGGSTPERRRTTG